MVSKSLVKYIQSLSHKKLRDEEGVFVAEGPKTVNELLNSGSLELKNLFAEKSWLDENRNLLNRLNLAIIEEITYRELERISFLSTPNTVLAIFKKPVFASGIREKTISLMLDTIQDPGNMGTILRCADWFGIDLVICSPECADAFNPKVVQASMGSIARVNVSYTNLQQYIRDHSSIAVYATTLDGDSVFNLSPLTEGTILIGNESRGIDPAILSLSTKKITIPRKGKAASLNAAVATGIVLSWLVR